MHPVVHASMKFFMSNIIPLTNSVFIRSLLLWMLVVLLPIYANAAANPFRVSAVVGDYAVTHYDIQQRLRFIAATTGLDTTPESIGKLYPRVLNTLIDEALQRQEASRFNISVSKSEVSQAITAIEKERGKPAGSLVAFMQENAIDSTTLHDQIEAQIAWSKLLQQRLLPKITVTESDIETHIQQLQQQKSGVDEVQIASLLLPATEFDTKAEAKTLADMIVGKLRSGVSFEALAGQLSSGQLSSSSPVWAPVQSLDPNIASALKPLTPPAILDPIFTPEGYRILLFRDKRRADYRLNAEGLFKEIILSLEAGATRQEVDLLMTIAKEVRKHSGDCHSKNVADITNLENLDFDVSYTRTRLSDISSQILPLVRGLRVGETSEPFATPEGIRLLKLCEKVDLPVSEKARDKHSRTLKEEKFQMEAVRYLRDLRRSSFVDIRD